MDDQPDSERLGYIPAVDGLRAVAVGSVVFFHLWPGLLPGGFTGVDIFFVISGFVVTGSMMGRRFETLKALLAFFYARRLMRIMPALVVMLLAATLAGNLFIPDAWLSHTSERAGEFAYLGLSNVVLATDTITYFGPQAAYNPFTHTWSLGVEEQFYLIFPFILFWHQRLRRRALLVVAGLTLGSLAICAAMTWLTPRFAYFLIFPRFWELGAGMLLCLTVEWWRARAGSWLAVAGPVLVAAGLALPNNGWFPFPAALLPVLGTAALIAAVVARPASLAGRVLASRPMVTVGLLSYSLYLWHWPVIVLFRWTVGTETLPLALLALGISCALAAASYYLVEKPLRTHPRIAAAPRGKVIGRVALVVLASLAVTVAAFQLHDRITLSVTRDRLAWYAVEGRPLDPARTHCKVRIDYGGASGPTVHNFVPYDCSVPRPGFTLFAVGDSHNTAYLPNYHQLSADLGIEVRSWSRVGCPFLKLNEPMRAASCQRAFEAMFADLAARVRPGDVVFLPALRQSRLTNQFGPENWGGAGPPDDVVTPEVLAEARGIVARLARTGAHVVIEAPKPLFRSPAFRCSDWFNQGNPACSGGLTMSRAELEAHSKSVRDALAALAAGEPGLSVWEPFGMLCPGAMCEAVPGGKPLFFDGDHLSGHGNDVVYPGLKAAVLGAAQQ